MAVGGAEGTEEGRVVGKGCGGAISDGLDVEFWWTEGGFMCGKAGDDFVEDFVNCGCG